MKTARQTWLNFINPGQDVAFKDLTSKKTSKQREGMLQAQCVRWFRYQYPTLLLVSSLNGAVLHGTKEQRARQWRTLESEGAVAGASDLFLFCPSDDYSGLCIEMKQGTGKQSEKQKEFQKKVEAAGYCYKVCKTFDEFQNYINAYLHT